MSEAVSIGTGYSLYPCASGSGYFVMHDHSGANRNVMGSNLHRNASRVARALGWVSGTAFCCERRLRKLGEDEESHRRKIRNGNNRARNEIICDTPNCRWGGDYDDATYSTYEGVEGGPPRECGGDEKDARHCCPRCLLANLIETDGWDDDQLPAEAFKVAARLSK